VATLVIWLLCLAVGILGHYFTFAPAAKVVDPLKPTEATIVNVSLVPSAATPPVSDQPPEQPQIAALPPLPAAAVFTPAVPFSVPVAGPVRIVPQAAAVVPPQTDGQHSKVPNYKAIYYGKGEGDQPKPDYPLECQLAGQAGTVGVEFIVGTDGRVASARVSKACQWPLLNQAAARSIRETWSFPAGPVRHYYIEIIYTPPHSHP
jgi:TonB family protein